MIERKILCRIALTRALYDQIRPYFFQKCVSNFDPPSTAQNHPKNLPPRGNKVFTCRKKGKSQLVLFVLDSFANRNTWNFPFFRQVPSYSRIQTKGQKAAPHLQDGHAFMVIGVKHKATKMEASNSKKNRVGFGCTEVSIPVF